MKVYPKTNENFCDSSYVTITNTGASALDISAVTNPSYNVNIMIERFN